MSKELGIKLCLSRIKRCIEAGNVHFINRKKNIEFLLKIGLTVGNVFDILMQLTPQNYHFGPLYDKDGSEGQVWIFIHPITNKKIYIKLKFFEGEGNDWMKVLSFHEEEK
ncbi:MAG: type II toxin-antitoxin system MqsR family toxin [Spirochaetales bacterium]|nr:type II toxin-antitoxin system MqsR family toxin [Spirochaetales bacterium]